MRSRESISAELLERFSDYLADRMGLYFSRERRADLERGLLAAARANGLDDAESWVRSLMLAPLSKTQIETLASQLTVGETYFFRDGKVFDCLETTVLPALIRKQAETGRRLRIWSAGCATGEEPYSIAILLRRLIPDLERWNIAILATDINPTSLSRAVTAQYGDWSFREVPAWIRERYFQKIGQGRSEILPEIRKLVTFSYLNLAEDLFPSLVNNTNAMDLIFCRNVLMYFSRRQQAEVVGKLRACLVDGGLLVVSPTEVSARLFAAFSLWNCNGAMLFKKAARAEGGTTTEGPWRQVEDREGKSAATGKASEAGSLPLPDVRFSGPPSEPAAVVVPESATPARSLPVETPASPVSLARLARAQANAGQLAAARGLCEQAIAADRLNPGYQYLLATILQEMGLAEEARVVLKRSLYLDPNFVLAHFSLGNLALTLDQKREASRHFHNALAVLRTLDRDDILPESEGVTAGRMAEIIMATSLLQSDGDPEGRDRSDQSDRSKNKGALK